ncbi:MAG: hypothetical protein QM760_01400 [Nibricoccus sp.]
MSFSKIRRSPWFFWLGAMIVTLLAAGCVSGPKGTAEEKRLYFQKLEETALADLVQKYPEAEKLVEDSVGYAVIEKKIVKVPVLGAGGGVGVVLEKEGVKRTYLKVPELQFGAGWGGRGEHVVILFQDVEKLRKLAGGMWHSGISAEAAAKAGDVGAAGGAATDTDKKGYHMYVLTGAGVSATVTLNVLRVQPYTLK